MADLERNGSDVARAAWLYYHEDFTQGEVAQALGVSRSTVTRLLRRAKDDGLVRINLDVTSGMFEAERDLERVFGLERARVVPTVADGATLKRWLGQRAADLVGSLVVNDAVVAVGWGTTMQAIADALVEQTAITGVQVVALVGGLHNAELGTNTNEIAIQFGQRLGATVRPLLAPVFVGHESTAVGLAHDPGIHAALALGRKASLVVFSLGAMHDEATLFKIGHIGGELKREILLATLRGGFATSLVTDESSAGYLLRAGLRS